MFGGKMRNTRYPLRVLLRTCGMACIGLLVGLTAIAASTLSTNENTMPDLTPEEARIIIHKGTEAPFSGAYLYNKADGTYACRQCGAALYRSSDKFESGCGWPAFDDAIPGAVKRVPDADGRREEILCAACGGHLGHVFEGERLTPKNVRHCVNSLSMSFVPAKGDAEQQAPATAPGTATAVFAGGCFWGVEDAFSKAPGVLDAVSGYTGGKVENPGYEQVSRGNTGHAEAVRVTYDPARVSYEELARLFFEIHDPTQLNRQGPDIGTQYRSAVFYANEEQKRVAASLIEQLHRKGWDVATELVPLDVFYPAEDYHQDFTARTGQGACHLRQPRFERGPNER